MKKSAEFLPDMIREIFLSLKLINPSRKRFTQRFIPPNFQTKISPVDFGSFALRKAEPPALGEEKETDPPSSQTYQHATQGGKLFFP